MAVREKVSAETKMVDISSKAVIHRTATAEGSIALGAASIALIRRGGNRKGDILAIAEMAGIGAAKKTAELIPLCHQIPLNAVSVTFTVAARKVSCRCTVEADWRTGVEMEALSAVSVALLTVWDMVKKTEKDEAGQYPSTEITGIRVTKKVKRNVGT